MSEEAKPTVPPNNIFIGKKPVTSYALAALMQLSAGFDEIVLKARGRAISKAVDVAEVLRNRFMKDELEVKSISIGTETAGTGEDVRNVSTIEIVLAKKK